MAAHAGERAEKSGRFHCAHCGATVDVKKGQKIPECPNGHKTFETRTKESGGSS